MSKTIVHGVVMQAHWPGGRYTTCGIGLASGTKIRFTVESSEINCERCLALLAEAKPRPRRSKRKP